MTDFSMGIEDDDAAGERFPADFDASIELLVQKDTMIQLEEQIATYESEKIFQTMVGNYVMPTWQILELENREPTFEEKMRMMVEEDILKNVLILSIDSERQAVIGNPYPYGYLTDAKKSYMAKLFVQGYITQDDAWYNFLNEYLSGDDFNAGDGSDGTYIGEALADELGEQRLKNLSADYLLRFSTLLKRHGLQKDDDLLITDELYFDLARIMTLALIDTLEAESTLDEVCREQAMTTDFTKDMKNLMLSYRSEMDRIKNE